MTGGLEQDRVFTALTRPQMFLGVTYTGFIANAVITAELFIISKSAWVLLVALFLHGFAYLICLEEPRALELWVLKIGRCPRVPNYAAWGCNSYRA